MWAVVLANLVPLFAAGAIIMTHDPVQLALWSATLYVVHRALTDRPHWWYGAGVLAGLTAQAKLNGLLLLPGVFLYLLLSPTARLAWLRRPQPYLAGLIALAIFSPFVWWNHTHENAFWIHIGAMGSRSDSHDPPFKHFGDFLGAQAALLSPFIFLTYLYTLYDGVAARRSRGQDEAYLFLWCPSAVVFAATCAGVTAEQSGGELGRGGLCHGDDSGCGRLLRAWRRGRRRRVWTGLNVAFAVAAGGRGTVSGPALRPRRQVPGPDRRTARTNSTAGGQMAARVAQERAAMGGDPFVFGVNYRMPSEAAFYLPGQPQTYSLFLHDRANEYMFWEDPAQLEGPRRRLRQRHGHSGTLGRPARRLRPHRPPAPAPHLPRALHEADPHPADRPLLRLPGLRPPSVAAGLVAGRDLPADV